MVSVDHFDEWYSAMSARPDARDELANRHLKLPPEVLSTSLLDMSGLLEIRDFLELTSNQVLLDLACGRGGYGLWLARDTGAKLIGVDFSPVAIDLARQNAASFGVPSESVEFRVGSLEATGLLDDAADAIVCIDAIQFADAISLAATEFGRVLRPGGRMAVTCWEALDRGDERIPERFRRLDLADQLKDAGFDRVEVLDRPEWRATERALWSEAVQIDPGDDQALLDLKTEAERVLPTLDVTRRVFAKAYKPI